MNKGAREGSALLITLGFMALLVTAAVCFSIQMRAARYPVSSLMGAERGRFLLAAALARAMSEIDVEIGDKATADWPGRVRGASDPASTNNVVPVLTFEALAYLPSALVEDVRTRATFAETARWQRLNYDAGRVAYLAVDVSDLPNANMIPAFTNRSYSAGGRVSLRPFFDDDAAARRFDEAVRAGRGEEPDVAYLSLLDFNVALGDAARILKGEPLTGGCEFVVDSGEFPDEAKDGETVLAVSDGEDVWRPILEEKLSETDMQVLDDYLDEDHVPSSLDIPCAERVPQLGAVGWLDQDGSLVPSLVLAFPFRLRKGEDGTFQVTISVSVSTDDGTHSASDEVSDEIVPSRDFGQDQTTYKVDLPLPETVLPPSRGEDGESSPEKSVTIRLTVRVDNADGETVDRIPELTFTAVCANGRLSSVDPIGYDVADSRVNWKPEQWRESEKPVAEWRGGECEKGCAVSDAGYLQSLGELAFLPREDGTVPETTGYGLVDDHGEGPRTDPYTTSTNIMMTALANTPCDWCAAATNTTSESSETLESQFGANRGDLEKIAVRLMTAVRGAAETGWLTGFDSLDWLVECDGVDPLEGLSFTGRLKSVDRGFLRDYWRGCLAKRQQLFLVFMRVEYGPRGLAVVARDPNPSPDDAPHRMRVLFYHQFDNRL